MHYSALPRPHKVRVGSIFPVAVVQGQRLPPVRGQSSVVEHAVPIVGEMTALDREQLLAPNLDGDGAGELVRVADVDVLPRLLGEALGQSEPPLDLVAVEAADLLALTAGDSHRSLAGVLNPLDVQGGEVNIARKIHADESHRRDAPADVAVPAVLVVALDVADPGILRVVPELGEQLCAAVQFSLQVVLPARVLAVRGQRVEVKEVPEDDDFLGGGVVQ